MVNTPLLYQEALLDPKETDKWIIRATALREARGTAGMGEASWRRRHLSSEGDRRQLDEEQEKGHSSSRNSVCRDTERETGSFWEFKEIGKWEEVGRQGGHGLG